MTQRLGQNDWDSKLYRVEFAVGDEREEEEEEVGEFFNSYTKTISILAMGMGENLEMEEQIGWIMRNKSIFISSSLEGITISKF